LNSKLTRILIGALSIPFFISFSPSSEAKLSDWEIVKIKGASTLRLKKNQKSKVALISDPSGAKLISTNLHKAHPHIELIHYYAGEHGTSQILKLYYAVIYDTKTKKILGNLPEKVEAVGLRPDEQPAQPAWSETSDKIIVYDPETELNTEISIK
jgi:hypothetical protein